MADGALLLVDAAEGPLPADALRPSQVPRARLPGHRRHQQDRPLATRAPNEVLERGLRPLLRPRRDRRADSTSRSSTPSAGRASPSVKLEDPSTDARAALRHRSSRRSRRPRAIPTAPLQILVSNVDHDDYVGRLAIGRIVAGTVRANQPVGIIKDGRTRQGHHQGALDLRGAEAHPDAPRPLAGEIVAIAGIEDVDVGDTIVDQEPGLGGARPAAHPRRAADDQDARSASTRRPSPARARRRST